MSTVKYTDDLRGVFPMFCLDVLCKRGFALRDRITDCLGFIADPDVVNTGALIDIRMLWGCLCPVVGIGRFERESAECWSVERRLKFIGSELGRDGGGRETRWFDCDRSADHRPNTLVATSIRQGFYSSATTMTSTVSVEISGPLATITFNRPLSLNAITTEGTLNHFNVYSSHYASFKIMKHLRTL